MAVATAAATASPAAEPASPAAEPASPAAEPASPAAATASPAAATASPAAATASPAAATASPAAATASPAAATASPAAATASPAVEPDADIAIELAARSTSPSTNNNEHISSVDGSLRHQGGGGSPPVEVDVRIKYHSNVDVEASVPRRFEAFLSDELDSIHVSTPRDVMAGADRTIAQPSSNSGAFQRIRSLPSEYVKKFKSLPKVTVGTERRCSEDGQQPSRPGSSGQSVSQARDKSQPRSRLKRMLYPSSDVAVRHFFGSSTSIFKDSERKSAHDSWVIHPFSPFRMAWTIIMIIVLAITVIVLPISVAYFYDDRTGGWLIFNTVCDLFFLVDIILSFRTGYIDERCDQIILDSTTIARRYASSWFILDIIGLLPIDYIFIAIESMSDSDLSYNEGRPLRVVRVAKFLELLKLLRVTRLLQQTSALSQLFNIAGAVFGAVRLMVVALLMSHWGACIIVFVPAAQEFPENSWVYMNELQNGPWYEQHFSAWFKTLSFMCGIGYGLITPVNMTDIWLSILLMLILSSTYIMLVGYFSAIVMGYDVAGKTYQSFIQEVDEFMIYRKLPMSLRSKIYDYFDYRYGGKLYEEEEVINDLSAPLKQEVINHVRQNLIISVPIFSKADSSFVHDVVSKLQHEYFQPGDLIIKANYAPAKMYFIEKGSVEIYSKEGMLVTRVKQGSYFGEIALMTGCARTATVRARTYLKLYSLSKDEFDPIIQRHPAIYRAMALVAIKRMESLGEVFAEQHTRLIDIITRNAEKPAKEKTQKKSRASMPESSANERA